MNKIVLITDLHWGCRNDLSLFYGYFEKFYNDLLEYMTSNNLKDLFILGDIMDRRKYINFKTLDAAKRIFFDKFEKASINIHVILGNHDIHYRESLALASPTLLLESYDNVRIYNKPEIVEISGTTISMIPWICRENENDIMNFIGNNNTDLCFGHFEFANFPMYKGIESAGGMDIDMFQKYELVCSGHYHTRSRKDNIVYIGTPYEMNWQDYGDSKGFHTFDLNTRELEFNKNPHRIFRKLIYDDKELINLDSYDLENCFVKLIVNNKNDMYTFDTFVNKLYNKKCYEIKIIEDIIDNISGEIDDSIDLEDTLDVLSNYISSIGLNEEDTTQLDSFMKSLYLEAINSEVV